MSCIDINADYFNEDFLKTLNEKQVESIYFQQYNEDYILPPIDKVKEEGNWVYKIYCYKDDKDHIIYHKHAHLRKG